MSNLSGLIEHCRQALSQGGTDVGVHQQVQQQGPACGIDAAQGMWLSESIGAVYALQRAAPLSPQDFQTRVMADWQVSATSRTGGLSSRFYPQTLPGMFFTNPAAFLATAESVGEHYLAQLWSTINGAPPATGVSHCGRLSDSRRYTVFRLPAPEHRFEAHFLACVEQSAQAPPRSFAMERGLTHEESVLVEVYADTTRIRLGQAGPAESQNFVTLIRQQLGL